MVRPKLKIIILIISFTGHIEIEYNLSREGDIFLYAINTSCENVIDVCRPILCKLFKF